MALTLGRDRTSYALTGPGVTAPAGEVRHEGYCLKVYHKTERVMSDVWEDICYVDVWDPVEQRVTPVYIGEKDRVTLDASPAITELANAWLLDTTAQRMLRGATAFRETRLTEALRIRRGARVVVARGRKVPKGTTGEVIWCGEGQWGFRVGVKTASGDVVWTALTNVDRTDEDTVRAQFDLDHAAPALDTYTEQARRSLTFNRAWYAPASEAVAA